MSSPGTAIPAPSNGSRRPGWMSASWTASVGSSPAIGSACALAPVRSASPGPSSMTTPRTAPASSTSRKMVRFESWRHEHRFLSDGPERSVLEDRITYRLPFGSVGQLVAGRQFERRLEDLFQFRHRRTQVDLARHAAADLARPQRIAISGASGLVGSQLVPFLRAGGHDVARLVRRRPNAADEIAWDPATDRIDAASLEGMDAVIHLAGVSIAGGRWTKARKAAILSSRLQGTSLLAETLTRLQRPPRVLISASGIGYYGDAGNAPLTEESPPGAGFLPTCAEPGRRRPRQPRRPAFGSSCLAWGRSCRARRSPRQVGPAVPVRGGGSTRQRRAVHELDRPRRPARRPPPGDRRRPSGRSRERGRSARRHQPCLRGDARPRPRPAGRSAGTSFGAAAGRGRTGRRTPPGKPTGTADPLGGCGFLLRVPDARRRAPARAGPIRRRSWRRGPGNIALSSCHSSADSETRVEANRAPIGESAAAVVDAEDRDLRRKIRWMGHD